RRRLHAGAQSGGDAVQSGRRGQAVAPGTWSPHAANGPARDRSAPTPANLVTARGDDLLAVGRQGLVLVVVHQVQRELADTQLAQFGEPFDVCRGRPDQTEPVDDVVRHEVRRRVARPAVVAVV